MYCFSNTEPHSIAAVETRMDDRGVLVRFPVGARDFSFRQSDHTGSGAYAAERVADQLLPFNVDVKNEWICTATTPIP